MLDDEDGGREVGGQLAEDRGERRRATGRGADRDDARAALLRRSASPRCRSRARGWVITGTRLATRRWRAAGCVRRGAGGDVERPDDVDRAGGDGRLGVLGGRAADHDRRGPAGHDPLDGLEPAAEEVEVDEDGVRAGPRTSSSASSASHAPPTTDVRLAATRP